MAKRNKNNPVNPPVVRSFEIDGITYTDGDKLQVIAPELGLLPVVLNFQDYSSATLLSMDFGWIRTPLPCRMNNRADSPNATLTFSCSRMPASGSSQAYISNTLRLVYFCLCDARKHTSNLVWHDVTFELGVIRASRPAMDATADYRRVTHPLVEGWQQLEPTTYEELKREPIKTDTKGQYTLFES